VGHHKEREVIITKELVVPSPVMENSGARGKICKHIGSKYNIWSIVTLLDCICKICKHIGSKYNLLDCICVLQVYFMCSIIVGRVFLAFLAFMYNLSSFPWYKALSHCPFYVHQSFTTFLSPSK
jgi:hypothetical protein